jgi:hypothetical protein
MGDSIGVQWFPALEKAFAKPGWKLHVITKSACPMIEKEFFYSRIGKEYTVCSEWRKEALNYVSRIEPDQLILGSSTNYNFNFADWEEGSRALLQTIAPRVGRITLLRGTPHLPFDGLDCLSSDSRLTRWLAGEERCSSPPAGTAHDDEIYAALRKAAEPFDNVRLLDMNDIVCPQGVCRAQRDKRIVFRDSQHLTAGYVSDLGDEFMRRLNELWKTPTEEKQEIRR